LKTVEAQERFDELHEQYIYQDEPDEDHFEALLKSELGFGEDDLDLIFDFWNFDQQNRVLEDNDVEEEQDQEGFQGTQYEYHQEPRVSNAIEIGGPPSPPGAKAIEMQTQNRADPGYTVGQPMYVDNFKTVSSSDDDYNDYNKPNNRSPPIKDESEEFEVYQRNDGYREV